MKKNGMPITRENYLAVNYPDGVPDELDPEELAEMDEIFGSQK